MSGEGTRLGCDLERTDRFDRLLESTRFMTEVFTAEERAYIAAVPHPSHTAAGVWCAKEACAKALGRGLFGLLPRELALSWNDRGAPQMALRGAAAAQYPDIRLSVSISHAGEYAMAVVLAE